MRAQLEGGIALLRGLHVAQQAATSRQAAEHKRTSCRGCMQQTHMTSGASAPHLVKGEGHQRSHHHIHRRRDGAHEQQAAGGRARRADRGAEGCSRKRSSSPCWCSRGGAPKATLPGPPAAGPHAAVHTQVKGTTRTEDAAAPLTRPHPAPLQAPTGSSRCTARPAGPPQTRSGLWI